MKKKAILWGCLKDGSIEIIEQSLDFHTLTLKAKELKKKEAKEAKYVAVGVDLLRPKFMLKNPALSEAIKLEKERKAKALADSIAKQKERAAEKKKAEAEAKKAEAEAKKAEAEAKKAEAEAKKKAEAEAKKAEKTADKKEK